MDLGRNVLLACTDEEECACTVCAGAEVLVVDAVRVLSGVRRAAATRGNSWDGGSQSTSTCAAVSGVRDGGPNVLLARTDGTVRARCVRWWCSCCLDDLVRVLCGGRRAVAISLDCEMPTI